jgi:hypothetical protein
MHPWSAMRMDVDFAIPISPKRQATCSEFHADEVGLCGGRKKYQQNVFYFNAIRYIECLLK